MPTFSLYWHHHRVPLGSWYQLANRLLYVIGRQWQLANWLLNGFGSWCQLANRLRDNIGRQCQLANQLCNVISSRCQLANRLHNVIGSQCQLNSMVLVVDAKLLIVSTLASVTMRRVPKIPGLISFHFFLSDFISHALQTSQPLRHSLTQLWMARVIAIDCEVHQDNIFFALIQFGGRTRFKFQ